MKRAEPGTNRIRSAAEDICVSTVQQQDSAPRLAGGAAQGSEPLGDVGVADLALAELQLARIEAACRFDGCAPDCRVRASALRSVVALAVQAVDGMLASGDGAT
jgi:hypothetical protein